MMPFFRWTHATPFCFALAALVFSCASPADDGEDIGTIADELTAPAGLSATAGDKRVVLTWRMSTSRMFSYYAVRRSSDPNLDKALWTRLPGNHATSTVTDTSAALQNGTTYYYFVTAIDKAGTVSAPSAVASATPTAGTNPPPPPPPPPPPAPSEAPLFNGDYSTGNFTQWPTVQNIFCNCPGRSYDPQFPATIVNDASRPGGKAARFELRQGNDFGIGERSEVQTSQQLTGISSGAVRWYSFDVKFDPSFYTPASGGGEWGVTNQFHSTGLAFGYLGWDKPGQWVANIKNDAAGTNFAIWNTPLDRGNWHHIKMEVRWSKTQGYVRIWRNGVPQTLLGGTTTWTGNTLNQPGENGAGPYYYKEGLYRATRRETGIVFHAGFRSATTEAGVF